MGQAFQISHQTRTQHAHTHKNPCTESRSVVYNLKCECLSVCVYERRGEGERESGQNRKRAGFSGKTGKRALSKSCLAKTNKRVSQRRENILKLIDVSSPCICYYFHCQGPLQRPSHRLAAIILAAIMLYCESFVFRMREGRVYFSSDTCWERSEPRCCTSSITSSVRGWQGRYCRSHGLEILTTSTLIHHPVFNPGQNISTRGLVRW